jgi:IclR family acetate operon transcriptional repressor
VPGSEPIKSVAKAAEIVKLIGNSAQGLRVSEVAAALGLKQPSTHHLVRTLLGCGFLRRRNGLLVLGDELLQLGRSVCSTTFQDAAAVEMQRLFAVLPRCTVVLAEASRYTLELTQRISYERPHVLERVHGQRFHVYANAVGLLALACGDREFREHLQQRYPFAEHGQHLWGTSEKLATHLAAARDAGYLECPFDRETSYRIAVPIRDGDGRFSAALGVSVVASQLAGERGTGMVVAELQRSANALHGTDRI